MVLVIFIVFSAFILNESIAKSSHCPMLFMCPSFCMRVRKGCYVCDCGSLNGILQQASNELNLLSAQKLSQTGSQMMSNPHVHSSITQSQKAPDVDNARYQLPYSSRYNQLYGKQGQTNVYHTKGGSGLYQHNYFMPGMSCGHISSDCPSVCWQTNIFTGCITCTCGHTKKPLYITDLPPIFPSSMPNIPLTQSFAHMKTPTTPRLKGTPDAILPMKVPTPPPQRTPKTTTTIMKLVPIRTTDASSNVRYKRTKAVRFDNQSESSKEILMPLTTPMSPNYSTSIRRAPSNYRSPTLPSFQTKPFIGQTTAMNHLNSNIDHSEGKKQTMNGDNRSPTRTYVISKSEQTIPNHFQTTTTSSLISSQNKNDRSGNEIKGIDILPWPNTGISIVNIHPISTGGTEAVGYIEPTAKQYTSVFGLPGISDGVNNSDGKIDIPIPPNAVLPKGAAGTRFTDENTVSPWDGDYLPGLGNDNTGQSGISIIPEADDMAVVSHHEGFGLYENVKSGNVGTTTA